MLMVGEYSIAILVNLLITAIELTQPFIVKLMIDYIESTDPTLSFGYGIGLASILIGAQTLLVIIYSLLDY
jgi:hypothetical protein